MESMVQISAFLHRSARLGGLVCVLLWSGLAWRLSLLENVLLLGMMVCVPLGISLVAGREEGAPSKALKLLVWLQPVGALLALVAMGLGRWGMVPAGLAEVWFLVTVCSGVWGLQRQLGRPWRLDGALCLDAALGYVVVGSVSFVAARAGWELLGFDLAIVFLTAVHFHFAGFAVPLLTGLAGFQLRDDDRWGRRLHKVAVCGVVFMPGVIGVAFSRFPWIELLGVLAFAISLWLLALLLLGWILPRQSSLAVQLLLGVAGVSLAVSTVFACLYAYGKFTQDEIIGISMMARTHGVINALGFSLCGILAFVLIGRRQPRG